MSAIISGDSPSITFSDATTQTTASPNPTTTGNIPFTTNGTSWSSVAKIVSGTAVASTSGTSIDFTSIPSWVKRITVMLDSVSTNGSSVLLVQVGAGSVTTSGYLGSYGVMVGASSSTVANSTTGFAIFNNSAVSIVYGTVVLNLLGSNTWVASGTQGYSVNAYVGGTGGRIALGGTLDRVRITTAGGTDTFDAGSINILYA